MVIDGKIVKRVAALSGIEIDDEKTEAMVEFFRALLGHFQGLEKCDVEGTDPFFDPDGSPCPLRGDEPVRWENRDEALEAGTLREGPFFIVPPISGAGVPDES